jgi:hypothetical protein
MEINQKFNRQEILSSLSEFKEIYKNRIIRDQQYGMKSPQIFGAWFMLKKLNPKYIIESGIWKGLGTWFFEKACPDSKIFSIDPELDKRDYVSTRVEYFSNDFSTIDWSMIDPKETVVFFDDHQNAVERVRFCQKLGFDKLIFEDNYPRLRGDCYSLKKVLSKKDYTIDINGEKIWHKHSEKDLFFLEKNVKHYQEFPPIFKHDVTRWGDYWTDDEYATPTPILEKVEAIKEHNEFYGEASNYTWICYVELK